MEVQKPCIDGPVNEREIISTDPGVTRLHVEEKYRYITLENGRLSVMFMDET